MLEVINSRSAKIFIVFLLVLFFAVLIWNERVVSFLLSYLLLYKYTTLFIIVFLAGLCIPIPMNILLVAVGALSIQGNFNFWISLIIAPFANLLGDLVALLLFRKYSHAILRDKYIKKYPFFLRLEKYFHSYTNISIFASRLLGVFSTPVNFLSGYFKIPITQFAIFDFLGNFVFAFLFLKLGYAVGDRWVAVSDFVNTIMNIIAIIIFFTLTFALFYNKKEE